LSSTGNFNSRFTKEGVERIIKSDVLGFCFEVSKFTARFRRLNFLQKEIMIKKWMVLVFASCSAVWAQDDLPDIDKAQKGENVFISGMKSFLAEDYAEALVVFNDVIKSYNPGAGVYHMKARTLESMGDLVQAGKAAEEALKLDESNDFYQRYYADLLKKNQDYTRAVEQYKKIIRKKPLDLESHVFLAEIYETTGDYDAALKVYEVLEKTIGTDDEISRKKQALYLRQNKINEAIREGGKLISNQPLEPSYVINQAQIMMGNGDINGAERLLKEYLGKNPDLGEAHVMLAEIYRRQENFKASNQELQLAFDNQGLDSDIKLKVLGSFIRLIEVNPAGEQIDKAIELAEKMISIDPTAAKAYVYLGDMQKKKGEVKAARDSYQASIKYDKSSFEVWQSLIELDIKLQDTPAIVSHAGMATEYFPNQPFFWYNYGFGNILKKDFKEAVYALEEARALTFENKGLLKVVLSLLGDAYNETKQYTDSEKAYEEALKIDPDFIPVLNNYSYFLTLRKRKPERAEELASRLYVLEPGNLSYADTYAWVLFQKGAFEEAREILEKAIKKSEKPSAISMEHYGDILSKLDDKQGAVEAWKKAKEIGQAGSLIDRKLAEEKYVE
jgi:tetratricopeptide (TPR) repeat protein